MPEMRTRPVNRDILRRALGANPEMISAFEAMVGDVAKTLPAAVDQAQAVAESAAVDGAMASAAASAAQQFAQAVADAVAADPAISALRADIDSLTRQVQALQQGVTP